jgi:hypothetical protein
VTNGRPRKHNPRATLQPEDVTLSREEMSSSAIDNDQDLTLAAINDFDLRKKVAELMAIAPGLPIRDLYGLLLNCKGQLEPATRQAVRASQAPAFRDERQPSRPIHAPAAPKTVNLLQDSDSDEVMIKIDLNEGFLEWVRNLSTYTELTLTSGLRPLG